MAARRHLFPALRAPHHGHPENARPPHYHPRSDGETPVLTRPKDVTGQYLENNLEIMNSSHVILRGLTPRGGTTWLRFLGANDHISSGDNEIADTDNNAIAMNSGDTDSSLIRHNHLHNTGLLPLSLGQTEGERICCHDGRSVGSNHVIERNYSHHLRGTSGSDGIAVKTGSYAIVVRDNVIHDTNIGTRYPCIFVYGGGPRGNIVEGNAVWHCGEAIQVVSDAIVRNNIILDSDVGITVGPHRQVPAVQRVSIVNNTIYGHAVCLFIRWQGARRIALANDAVYCSGGQAVDARGLNEREAIVVANVVEGALAGDALVDGSRFRPRGSSARVFRNPAAMDYWPTPGAPLLGAALSELAPRDDFNGTWRIGAMDIGAYHAGGRPTNRGWRTAGWFKGD